MTRTLRVVSGMVATGVLALVFTSCGGSHDDVQRAVVPTTPETTVPVMTSIEATDATTSEEVTPLSDEEAIVAAYHEFWEAWVAANNPPDPSNPELPLYMTGKALETAYRQIDRNYAQGVILRLPDDSAFSFSLLELSIREDTAHMQVCLLDDGEIVNSSTGDIVDGRQTSNRIDVELLKQGRNWLVSENNYVESFDGLGGCE